MKQKTLCIIPLFLLIIPLLLAACSAKPVKTTLPLYPQATLDSTGKFEDLRKSSEDAEKKNVPGWNVEVKAYTTDAAFDDIASFFTNKLTDWKDGGRTNDPSGIIMQKWSNENEIMVLLTMPNPSGDPAKNVMMVEQVWK